MADLTLIRERMEVMSSDGELVGHVHGVSETGFTVSPLGGAGAGGHPIDPDWVSRVDEHVHLRHNAAVVRGGWSGNGDVRPNQQMGKARLPWLIGLVLLAIAVMLLIWSFLYAADDGPTTEPLPSTGQQTNGG
ncbi:MAG TPA: DUF2171 domain-containing protein [Allosphingosinicella sp.]|jgi:hypothetical protein